MKPLSSPLFVIVCVQILAGCGKPETPQPAASVTQPAPQTQTAPAAVDIFIRQNRQLYAGERLILSARPHEGFSDPQVSPGGRWVIVLSTDPNDIPGTRAEQYGVLINLRTGERFDQYDLAARFHVADRVIGLRGWNPALPATFRVLLSSGSEIEITLPAAE